MSDVGRIGVRLDWRTKIISRGGNCTRKQKRHEMQARASQRNIQIDGDGDLKMIDVYLVDDL